MQFELNSYEDGTYISYRVGYEEKIDNYALNTIMNNNIDGIFKMNKESENGADVFYINVTSQVPLAMLLDKPVQKDFIINVIERLVKISKDADDYLLNPDYFLFEHENIYIDLSTKKVSMIYLPIVREGEKLDIKQFIKKLIFDVCYDVREDCNYVARLLNVINSKEPITLEKTLEAIRNIKKMAGGAPASLAPSSMQQVAVSSNVTVNSQETSFGGNSAAVQNNGFGGNIANNNSFNNNGMSGIPSNQSGAIPVAPVDNSNKKDEKKSGFLSGLFAKKEKEEKAPKPAKPAKTPNVPSGMAIPGQPAVPPAQKSGGMAVPGQPAVPPAQKSGGMAVPGQAAQFTPASAPAPKASQQMAVPGQGMAIPGQAPVPPKPAAPAPQPAANNFNQGYANVVSNAAPIEKDSDDIGSTIMIGGSAAGGKTVLKKNVAANGTAKLTRLKTNESVAIGAGQFKIGREKSFVNFFIGDNATIGRVHAQIDFNNGKYYLTDINSLNHTYMGSDTQPIQAGQPYELYSGIKFRLSDEEFMFTIG